MAAITYRNASCIYEGSDKLAVDSLNLDIEDGEFVVLVGPSGSRQEHRAADARRAGGHRRGQHRDRRQDMVGVPSKDRDIAMVFQNYALYPTKTVAENMGFALKLRGVSAGRAAPKGRGGRQAARPERVFGPQAGQTVRRSAPAGRDGPRHRAEPQVFCMDEPLSNLDAKLRVQTRTQIAALQRRLGTTTVYVTHDQVEAMTMGDRVAVLRNGKLQQFASPTELYDRPANVFVAGFIGSPAMNLLTAPITSSGVKIGEDSALDLDRDQFTLLHTAGLDHVTIGIRPEHLRSPRAAASTWSSTWSKTSAAKPTCTPTPAPTCNWSRARSRATRLGTRRHRRELRKHPDGAVHLFHPDTGDRIG